MECPDYIEKNWEDEFPSEDPPDVEAGPDDALEDYDFSVPGEYDILER